MNPSQLTLEATPTLVAFAERSLRNRLEEQYHPPIIVSKSGKRTKVSINEMSVAALLAEALLITRDPRFGVFYHYNDIAGIWSQLTDDRLKVLIDDILREEVKAAGLSGAEIVALCSNRNYREIIALLKGRTEQDKDPFESRPFPIIHVENGVLRWNGNGFDQTDHHPTYYSRAKCPIPFRLGAECPKFQEFLAIALPLAEDRELLQLIAGQWLIGKNITQRIIIFKGTAGAGKSTLLSILKRVIGTHNVTELRTQHLSERFEIHNFLTKNLLVGSDVPSDFLQHEGAQGLKKLTGGDTLLAEKKFGPECRELSGTFNVAITTNNELTVKLSGDSDAWARRLIIFEFLAKIEQAIPSFDEYLVSHEGEGILFWMVEGAAKLLRSCGRNERLPVSQIQQGRVDEIVARSDSLSGFVKQCVVPGVGDLTTMELLFSYNEFCSQRGWVPTGDAERKLRPLISAIFGRNQSHDIKRDGRCVRGYRNLKLRNH